MSIVSVFIIECSHDSLINDPFFILETHSSFAHHSLTVGDEFYIADTQQESFISAIENESQQKIDDAWRKRIIIKAKHHSIMRNEHYLTHTIRLALEVKIV